MFEYKCSTRLLSDISNRILNEKVIIYSRVVENILCLKAVPVWYDFRYRIIIYEIFEVRVHVLEVDKEG